MSKDTFPEDFQYHKMDEHLYCYDLFNSPLFEGEFCKDFRSGTHAYGVSFEEFSKEESEIDFDDYKYDSDSSLSESEKEDVIQEHKTELYRHLQLVAAVLWCQS